MIEILGWLSTAIVLVGFVFNAKGRYTWAMITWIVGDVGWITYDFLINNFSHLTLSLVIIAINVYGIINLKKQ